MAFDGITIANLQYELAAALTDGRISKIIQPETDELILTVKSRKQQYKVLLSASASLPLVYLTESSQIAPMTAPNFCMLLRKYIGGGRIVSIEQPHLERILIFHIEHRNEMGDLCCWRLIIELMGKHSNIILVREDNVIMDSIKHISAAVSSVREVLPGRSYFIPKTLEKQDPLTISESEFAAFVCPRPVNIAKALYTSLNGISPLFAEELCQRASLDGGMSAESLSAAECTHLYHTFARAMEDVRAGRFTPTIYYRGSLPLEFSALELTQYRDAEAKAFPSISSLLEAYYAQKNLVTRIRQKSTDLRKIVTTLTERTSRKLDLQQKQMRDTEKKDKYRIWGELLHTYGYSAAEGDRSLTCLNYYTNEEITIPLDDTLSASDNAKRYFERYNKLKRTAQALEEQILESEQTLEHLESIRTSLDTSENEEDLSEIREELIAYGFIKNHRQDGRKQKNRLPGYLHYKSCDGFDIYIGKNNYQNEEISFKLASGNDWWFHAKGMPGSHVIVKNGGQELSDAAFEECGRLAAYYSKGRQAPKVEIDYTLKKNLRKPGGARPGFVVYYTNYSLMASPDIRGIKEL